MTPEPPEQRDLPSAVFPGRDGLGACRSLRLGRTWVSPAWLGGTEPRAQVPFSLCVSERVQTFPGEGYPQRPLCVCLGSLEGGPPRCRETHHGSPIQAQLRPSVFVDGPVMAQRVCRAARMPRWGQGSMP